MTQKHASITMAITAIGVELLGASDGGRYILATWIATGVAVLLALAAVVIGIRSHSRVGWILGILAILGSGPIIFVSGAAYTCATYGSCM